MFDVVIVGAGICGLNLAKILNEKTNKKMCILEKSNRVGGLIDTRFVNFDYKENDKKKKVKVKYENGGAVVFGYQKNMKKLIKELGVNTMTLPLDKKGRHQKHYYDGEKRKKPLGSETTDKYFNLVKKVFKHMNKMSDDECRKLTFEQMCLQVLTFDETRFIEFCYGYAAEFRIANAVIARKNIENELFNSKEMYFFTKENQTDKNYGYIEVINSLRDKIKDNVPIKLKTEVISFTESNDVVSLTLKNKEVIKTKKVVFAIPKEALQKLCSSFTSEEFKLFDSVDSSSLTRLFAKYDLDKNPWIKDMEFSTVNNPIRQIIPKRNLLKKNIGFLQISYSDWYFADYWGSLNMDSTKVILKNLLTEAIHKTPTDPDWIKKTHWKNAVHFWKPNVNEKKLNKRITKLRNNVLIGGESFSLNQGWCEGAVQSSIQLSKILI